MSPICGEAGACRAGWRSCFLIGLEAALQMPSAGSVLVVFMLPSVVAMVVLAARMWRAAAVPASRNLELAVVPAHARGLPRDVPLSTWALTAASFVGREHSAG